MTVENLTSDSQESGTNIFQSIRAAARRIKCTLFPEIEPNAHLNKTEEAVYDLISPKSSGRSRSDKFLSKFQ